MEIFHVWDLRNKKGESYGGGMIKQENLWSEAKEFGEAL